MKLTLGFSPCPNDTFIFDALVNRKIETDGFEFEVVLEDVQTLNQWAIEGKLDVSKISYGVLPLILDQYLVLNSGGALGKGVGPLLIRKQGGDDKDESVSDHRVGIPGENTTAHMLYSLAYPQSGHKQFMIFSDIEQAVLEDRVDYGVIIHENRFTYQEKGLHKVVDLGDYWEKKTGLPIPLGGIVIRKNIDAGIQRKVDQLIRSSITCAFSNYPHITGYVKQHSQEMSESVMRQHIDLYVNDFSVTLGPDGRHAVSKLLEVYSQLHPEVTISKEVFIGE